jgi:hypothetical protein
MGACEWRLSYQLSAFSKTQSVILSDAKDLLSRAPTKQQVLRFAQDDNKKGRQ